MFKKILLTAFISLPCYAEVAQSLLISSEYGVLTSQRDGGMAEGFLLINGKKVGIVGHHEPQVTPLGKSEDKDYYLISIATGGSGCSESMTLVEVGKEGYHFSNAINACGGFVDASIDYKNNVVKVNTLDRRDSRESYTVHLGSDLRVELEDTPDFESRDFFHERF